MDITTVRTAAQRVEHGVDAPLAPERSEATRYLCAAAHLDRGLKGRPGTQLRRAVEESLAADPIHAIGTSPGVDLRQVVLEVRRAAHRKLARDVILAVLAILGLVVVGASGSTLVALLFFLLACEVVHVEAWISTYAVVARRMLRGRFEPQAPDAASGRLQRLLGEIETAQSGNVTVYSGFTPFVGVGEPHGGWSFSVNLSEGKTALGATHRPRRFDVADLYAHVAADIEALGLPNVSLHDRLYADGRRLREDDRLLEDPLRRPAASVPAGEVDAAIGRSGEAVRHYLVIRVIGWGGELVLSIFVRFMQVERSLFAEASFFLLPPLNQDCHAVDGIQPVPGWRDNLRLFRESALATPLLWARSPFEVVRSCSAPLRHALIARRLRRQAAANPDFDYGATTTVREQQRARQYRQYFQVLDRDMYAKVVERQLLDSLCNFLDDHDVDTSEMRQRGTTILNNGVMLSGGTLQAGNVAVGARAKVKGAKAGAKPSAGAAASEEPAMHENEGIILTGGTINAGALAVGRGARAVQRVEAAAAALGDHDDVAARLRELTALLAAHPAQLERPDEVLAATERVAEELTRPEPSRLTLAAVLDGILGAASGVAGVAAAVTALRTAIGL